MTPTEINALARNLSREIDEYAEAKAQIAARDAVVKAASDMANNRPVNSGISPRQPNKNNLDNAIIKLIEALDKSQNP